MQNPGGKGVDPCHIAADGGNLAGGGFFKADKIIPTIVLLRHNVRYGVVDLHGDDVAGVGDGDLRGQVLQKDGHSSQEQAQYGKDEQQRQGKATALPWRRGKAGGINIGGSSA